MSGFKFHMIPHKTCKKCGGTHRIVESDYCGEICELSFRIHLLESTVQGMRIEIDRLDEHNNIIHGKW